jgi:hypothetical protein
VRRADNLATFMCRLSKNLGASTSCNPQGLSRPVMGLLYLFTLISKGAEIKWVQDVFLSSPVNTKSSSIDAVNTFFENMMKVK